MEKERETDKTFAPLTVIKVGGAVVEDEAQLTRLINDFAAIPGRKVLYTAVDDAPQRWLPPWA